MGEAEHLRQSVEVLWRYDKHPRLGAGRRHLRHVNVRHSLRREPLPMTAAAPDGVVARPLRDCGPRAGGCGQSGDHIPVRGERGDVLAEEEPRGKFEVGEGAAAGDRAIPAAGSWLASRTEVRSTRSTSAPRTRRHRGWVLCTDGARLTARASTPISESVRAVVGVKVITQAPYPETVAPVVPCSRVPGLVRWSPKSPRSRQTAPRPTQVTFGPIPRVTALRTIASIPEERGL